MKKVWIFFLGLMMLAAIALGAVACNKGEEEETGTRVVLYDFEQTILPVGMFQDFGALDINEDADYVHGGARSLELRPASDGETEPLMYFPFESSVLGFDHKNGDRISEVRFWCYAPKQMTVQAGLYFTADAGKRSAPSEIALEQGWNEAVYTLDHASLALVNDLSATYGFYLIFTADTVPASENVKLYVDDLTILVQDEDIEYTVVIPELTKQTGDVIAFNTINFGVVEQKSTGTSDWFSEFEGRDGVVALEANSDWPYYRNRTFWTAAYDKAYYEDYDFLVFRAYATGVLNAYYHIQDASPAIEYKLEFTEENSGRWVDFVLPIDTFLDNFDSFKTLGQFMTYAPSDETVYIDSIRAVNTIEESYAPEKASATEGETVSLVAAGLAEAYPDTEFTYIVNGMTVADPSAFVLGDAGTYTVVYEGVADGKLMRGEYVFTSLIRGEELTYANKIAEPGAKIDLVPDELDKNHGDISFTFTVNGNRVVDPSAYTVENEKGRYTVYFEGADATGYLYYGSYILSVGDYGDNFADVYTYDTAASAPTGGDVNNASWLASYEGAEGVLKMDVGSWDWLGYMNTDAWQPYFGKDTYEKYEYLAFRVRLEGLGAGETMRGYFKVEGAVAEDNAEYGLSLTANTDGWTTVLMPIDILVNNLDGFAQKTQWTFYIEGRSGTSSAVLYVDSLMAVNVAEGKNVEASVGDTLDLVKLSGIGSAEGAAFTVNGAAVSDPAKYTVAARGRYTVMYISADNTQIGTFELLVGKKDNAGADVVMFDFSASGDRPTVNDPTGLCELLSEFEGADGVLKLEASTNWPAYSYDGAFKPIFDKAVYQGYEYLEFRVYATGELNLYFQVGGASPAIEYMLQFGNGNLETNQWVTCRLSIDTFLNNYDSFLQNGQFLTVANVAPEADSAYVYIDSIRAVNYSEVTVEDISVVVNEAFDFSTISALSEATELSVQIDGVVQAGTSFTPTAAGEYSVVITGVSETGYIRAEFIVRAAEKGMVLDFSSKGDAPTGGDVTEAELLDSYEGATGVLKMHVGIWKGYTNASGWKPIFDSSDYSGYTHLAFRVKVEGFTGTNFKFYYKVEGTGGDSAVEYVIEFTANTDGWTTVYLPIKTFADNYSGFAEKTQITFLNTPESNETQTYLYLDSICAVNYSEITVDDIAVEVGEQVDFSSIAALAEATELTVQIDGVVQAGTSFTPTAAGEYTVVITGETGTQYFRAEFTLRAAEEGMVLDFSSAGDVPTGGDVTEATWLNEYDGVTGVLKMHVGKWKGYTNASGWKPIFDSSDYSGYSHLAFRVKVEGFTGTNFKFYYKVEGSSGDTAAEYVIEFTANTDGWTTVYLPIKTFADNYSGFAEKTQITFLNTPESNETQTYLYLDSIRAVNYSEITVGDMAVEVGEQVDFSSIEALAGATELTVQIDGEKQQGASFTPDAAGEYSVVITGVSETGYIGAAFAVRAAEKGMVLDFSSKGDAPTGGDVTEATWLNEYDGVTGVLKMHVGKWKDYTNASGWKPIFDSSDYSGYTHLAFRVKVEGFTGTNFKFYYKVEGSSGDTAAEYVIEFTANTDGWTTVYLPIKTFADNFSGFAEKTQITFLNDPESNETQTYLYLDSICAVNYSEITVDDIAVEVGEQVDFSSIAALAEATELTVQIDGEKQQGTSFTPDAAGEYSVVITGVSETGYIGAAFAVRAAEKGMVLDFSSKGDAPTGGDVTEATWLNEYDGVTGVLKMHVGKWKGYTNASGWKPIFDSSDYSGYSHLAFRVKVEGFTGTNFKFYYKVENSNDIQYVIEFTANTDGWTTVYLPIKTFADNYSGFAEKTQITFLNTPESNETQTYLYLDSICAVNYSEIAVGDMAVEVGEQVDFSSIEALAGATELTVQIDGEKQQGTTFTPAAAGEYSVVITGVSETGYIGAAFAVRAAEEGMVLDFSSKGDAPTGGDVTEAELLDSYEGATGVLKMHVGKWKGYTNASGWKPIFDSSDYSGYTHLAFRVKVEGFTGTNFKFYYKVEGTGGDSAVEYVIEFTANTNGWTTVYLPIETFVKNLDGFAQKTQFTFINTPESNETQTYLYLDSICAVNYSEITVGDMAVEVGEQVDFSSIAAFAEATELIVQIDGETQQGTAFTPASAGEYSVVITGETGTQYFRAEFTLRAAEEGMVLDFSSAGDAPTGGDVTEAELLDSYEGVTGVLKMHVGVWKGYTNASGWKPIFDSSVYKDYTHLAFRIKVEGFTGTNFKFYYKVEGTGGDSAVEYVIEFTANTNGWTTVYLPIETFVKNLDGFAQKTQFTFINTPESNETQTYLYLDSIRAVNYSEVTVDDMAVVVGEKVDFSSIAAFAEATELTVQIDGEKQQGTTFTPAAAGEYSVVITGVSETGYIGAAFAVRAAEEGMVLDFSASGDRPTVNDSTGLCELLSEFEGADGVLKLEASTNWPAYSYNGAFKPIFDKAVYQGYEYLEFRVYATGVLNLYFQVGGANPAIEYMLQFGNGNLETNQWVTCRLSIDTFLNNYDSFLQNGRFLTFANVAPEADSAYVYIDSIRAVNATE